MSNYNSEEQGLIDSMPSLLSRTRASVSNVWIVEWLREGDQPTGQKLHGWMQGRRAGWSHLDVCRSRAEVMDSIARAASRAAASSMRLVLHIETHGGELGIEGQDGQGSVETISWDELRPCLVQLNRATGCNLLVFMAACTGFAGIGSLVGSDRAPALALIGSAAPLMDVQLLRGSKEFYRRLIAADSTLHEMAEAASIEAGDDVHFEPEVYPVLAREALIDMVMSRAKRGDPVGEEVSQQLWDQAMMIDLEPSNRDRFGLDVRKIVRVANSFYAARQ